MKNIGSKILLAISPLCGALVHILLIFNLAKGTNRYPQTKEDCLFFIVISFLPYLIFYIITFQIKGMISSVFAIFVPIAMACFDIHTYLGTSAPQSRAWLNILVPIVFLLPAAVIGALLIRYLDKKS